MTLQEIMKVVKYGTRCNIFNDATKEVEYDTTWKQGFSTETQFTERQLRAEVISVTAQNDTVYIKVY